MREILPPNVKFKRAGFVDKILPELETSTEKRRALPAERLIRPLLRESEKIEKRP